MVNVRILTDLAQLAAVLRSQPEVVFDLTEFGREFTSKCATIWPTATVYAPEANATEHPNVVGLDVVISDARDWGAKVSRAHGVLAGNSGRTSGVSSGRYYVTTIDDLVIERGLKEISVLLLPATPAAAAVLLGASRTLSAERIIAVGLVAPNGATGSIRIPPEFAGILAKFQFFWAPESGENKAPVSLAVSRRLEGSYFPERAPALEELWFAEAQRLAIPIRGAIHVGAHDGEEAAIYRQAGLLKIFMIEANPEVFDRLRSKFANADDIVCIHATISDRAGPVTMHLASNEQSASILAPADHLLIHSDVKFAGTIELEANTLDALAVNYAFEECNLLNMDIQGAELLALAGAERLLQHMDLISLEVNFRRLYEGCAEIEDIDGWLGRRGFIRTRTLTPYHASWGDAVYVRKERLWCSDPLQAIAFALQGVDAALGVIGSISEESGGTNLEISPSRTRLEQSFELELQKKLLPHGLTQIIRLPEPVLRENRIAKFPVVYQLRHNDPPRERQVAASVQDVDFLVLGSRETSDFYRYILALATKSRRLAGFGLLGPLADAHREAVTQVAFDSGFVVDRTNTTKEAAIFIRSGLIRDAARWLDTNNSFGSRDFRFSFLGELGQYGNQLFELWHLILYALKHDARAWICPWRYNEYFDFTSLEREGCGEFLEVDPRDWKAMGLWAGTVLPDGTDLLGHFQWIPKFLRNHRVFLARCFELRPEWAAKIGEIVRALAARGNKLTAFHVRRADYLAGALVNPWVREIPVAWYHEALHKLSGTTIYAASDDLDFVRSEFAGLEIVTWEDFSGNGVPALLIDHCVMRAADNLLMINSTFSRTAAMLGKDGQSVQLPSIHSHAFEAYDPWNDPVFWFRFELDDHREFEERCAEVYRWLAAAGVSDG